MNYLIFGTTGQVAHHLKILSSTREGNFTFVSREEVDLTNLANLQQFLENYQTNITNTEPKIIIIAAAYTNVEGAESDAENAFLVNEKAVQIIAEFAAANDYLLVHYSTDYIFDGTSLKPYEEDDQPNALSVYGKSKLAGEEAIIASGANYLIMRTSWVFSEIGVNFVKKISQLMKERPELKVIDDQRGCPTYAGFIADITFKLLDKFKASNYHIKEIINVCQAPAVSWFEFACAIKEELQKTSSVSLANLLPIKASEYPAKAQRPQNSVLTTGKLQTILNDKNLLSWDCNLPASLK